MTAPTLPSKRASSFKKLYSQLPEKVQHEADEAYRQFKTDPDAHGLNFKQIAGIYYSARVAPGIARLRRAAPIVGFGSGLGRMPTTTNFSISCDAGGKAYN